MQGKKRAVWIRALLWCAVALVALMIFAFSAQNGVSSSKVSSTVLDALIRVLQPLARRLARGEVTYSAMEHLLRKIGHLSEFALLGFCLRMLMHAYGVKGAFGWAWAAGTLYAATDEFHQLFSDGRGASIVDVGIDSVGVCLGAALAALILSLIARRRKRRS